MKKMNWNVIKDLFVMLFFAFAATVAGGFFTYMGMQITNVVVVYILSVLLTARLTEGYSEGIIASIVSLLLFNFFFTEPIFTLKVNDLTYLITFFIMTITALITSALTTKSKKAAQQAHERELESNALYLMTNHLTDAEDISEVARVMVRSISSMLDCKAGCIAFDENGEPESSFIQLTEDGSIKRRELWNTSELKVRMERVHMSCDKGREFYDWPVYGSDRILGVLRIPSDTAENMTESQTRMLVALNENAALAIERLRGIEEQAKVREDIEKERYRGNLLRAISHDIRTPLAGIMGSSEMLMNMTKEEPEKYQLAEGIYQDADWLHGLVENILSMTRLQDGGMVLDKQPEALEEVIGAALSTMEKRQPGREITVDMPEQFLMIPMNARLINQVVVNLLDNAAAHSSPDSEINVTVKILEEENKVSICVADQGTGISDEDFPKIFQMFYTTRRQITDSRRGIGLGLAICQSIVKAHGGEITARNRTTGQGAEFEFTLPMGDEQNE